MQHAEVYECLAGGLHGLVADSLVVVPAAVELPPPRHDDIVDHFVELFDDRVRILLGLGQVAVAELAAHVEVLVLVRHGHQLSSESGLGGTGGVSEGLAQKPCRIPPSTRIVTPLT